MQQQTETRNGAEIDDRRAMDLIADQLDIGSYELGEFYDHVVQIVARTGRSVFKKEE